MKTRARAGGVERLLRASSGALIAVALVFGLCVPAYADKQASASLYETGKAEYNLGNFAKAIEHFESAYREFAAPAYLYNIAQSYRMLGNCEKALFFYDRFLSVAPGTKQEPTILGYIAELEKSCTLEPAAPVEGTPTTRVEVTPVEAKPADAQDGSAAQVPLAEREQGMLQASDTPSHESEHRTWSGRQKLGLGFGVVGFVGMGLGSVFGLQAIGYRSDALNADVGACDKEFRNCNQRGADLFQDAGNAATVANIGIGIGIAASVTGLVLWLTADKSPREPRSVQIVPSIDSDSLGFSVAGGY